MSKKQLHSRLKDLFTDLAITEAGQESQPDAGESEAPDLLQQGGLLAGEPTSSEPVSGEVVSNPVEPPPAVKPSADKSESPAPSYTSSRSGQQTSTVVPVAIKPFENVGVALKDGNLHPAEDIWTEVGRQSLVEQESSFRKGEDSSPATIAVPFQMQGVGDLLLEIVDDSNQNDWSEDDRFMVMEIVAQLALALDNAQLYISAQQELGERVRAEQAILRRNRDLSTLNRIGQQLSRLATRSEIFDLLSTMVGEILDNRNLIIATYNQQRQSITFPVYRVDGEATNVQERPVANGLIEYAINLRKPLLVTKQVQETLTQLGITSTERLPMSLLTIPMVAGERPVGVILVQDFEKENVYDNIHVELLSTAASQATTALENADLFQQMQSALEALENRERYQANVARGAATLTEFGTKAMPDVLKLLGQAAQCSRVFFAQVKEDERGVYWSSTNEWTDSSVAYLFDKTRILHIPITTVPGWVKELREKGWVITTTTDNDSPEAEFIKQQHIHSTLVLAIPGKNTVPNLLAFDQLGSVRTWQNEEINALRVGADAIANTFVREDLLDQLQVSLDETENLYKASNRLAMATDMQEMVAAVVTGVRSPDLNRAILLLHEQDSYGKVTTIKVAANWYSGRGTPPPPVGMEFPRARFERFFQAQAPLFAEDIADHQSGDQLLADGIIDDETREVLQRQNIHGLAILPLWTGKRQTGVMMLQSENRHRFTGREMRTYPPLADQMAIAVDNQRLFEQTQSSLAETELLYKVSNLVSQAADPKDMLALVAENVMPEGADRASLFLIDSDVNGELLEMELVGIHDVKGEYQQMGLRMPITSFPLVKSLTDEPIIITDINEYPLDPASRKSMDQHHMISSCLVPLRTSGRLIGVLTASSQNVTEYDQEETRLLRIIGNGIAVALEKQRLLRQAQRRALELQTASEIARDTASTLTLDLLLNRIVKLLSDRFGFYHTAIFLMDETATYAQIREATGEAGMEMKQRNHRLAVGSRSVVGTVSATGEPLILNDVVHSPMHYPNPLLPATRSEMGIPLKISNKVIGSLDLQSREINAFNQDDVTVLQILADQIAIAIENARAYELSQKAISDMREVDRVKSQFLANMSHELRTPLNSIIGFSRVILKGIDGPINDTQKQDLSAIYNSGQHLLSLINDILDLSKIEAGKLELAISDVNLVDMINSVMSTAAGLVKDKSIKLLTNIPEQLPPVRADATRTRQVLINFLSNAAKFTEEGSVTVETSVITSPKGKPEVIISVTDTGPGISQDDWGKLFLPFSQVDDSPTRKTGGTGLGLSICRSLIEMQGGRIGLLWSEVGKGSTFFFTIPTTETVETPKLNITSPGSNVILAVDDDQKVIDLYERYLRPHGYTVIALTSPKKAVERAKEVHPFAITLDIMMPEKDGWQVMRDLKNDPQTRDIPIVICSIMENQEKGFSMGAADYLVKPFLQEDLINAINRLNRDGQICEVLVIDDDPADLRLVQKMLDENQKLHVNLAEGGKHGWDMIQTQKPDVIILDLFMPDMNGFTILENLRSSPGLRDTPVIVLTGADLNPDQHKMLADFGQGLLTKGYLREKELLVILEEALRKFNPVTSAEE
jgi:signal transduction histidine kinase/CheY-like chemotaxis protein